MEKEVATRQIKRMIPAIIFMSTLLVVRGYGQTTKPNPISPDSLHWVSPPAIPGLQSAWLVGVQDKPGLYIMRVKLKKGTMIPPHTHPDDRNTTVLAGTIYIGFGEVFDAAKAVVVTAGSVYVVPANVPHYIWAQDGDAMYQESGYGPTGNVMIRK